MGNWAIDGTRTVIKGFDKLASRAKYLHLSSADMTQVFEDSTKTACKSKYIAQDISECNVEPELLNYLQENSTTSNIRRMAQQTTNNVSIPTVNQVKKPHKVSKYNSKYDNPEENFNYVTIRQLQHEQPLNSDWGNTGWKLHLPVEPNVNNPLTKDICDFLNKKWGLDITKRIDRSGHTINSPSFFQQGADDLSRYKVGECGGQFVGKGMTIYGTTGSQEEIFKLADELENKFGLRIANSGYPIYTQEMHVTPHISTRFVDGSTMQSGMDKHVQYCEHINKDALGNVIGKNYGTCVSSLNKLDKSHWPQHVIGNKTLENEFMAGDSIVETIRDYGEMFTGKITNGKIPDFIIKSFSPEYLKYHPNIETELLKTIEQGNLRYVKAMLLDISTKKYRPISNTEIPILYGSLGKIDYLSKIDKKLIEQAKQELAQTNPNFMADYFKNLQSSISSYPQLANIL